MTQGSAFLVPGDMPRPGDPGLFQESDDRGMLWRLRLPVLALTLLLALPAIAQAGPPASAIFFYPWYSNMRHDGAYAHWTQGGHTPPFDVASQFYPLRGAYSSGDPSVLRAQMHDIAAAGIDEVVSSWWGQGSREDLRLRAVIRAAKRYHLRVDEDDRFVDGRRLRAFVVPRLRSTLSRSAVSRSVGASSSTFGAAWTSLPFRFARMMAQSSSR